MQDEDSGELFYTSIVCPLLDRDTSRCTAYVERFAKMPSCTKISSDNIRKIARWLPKSCAYRCLLEGLALPDWHPLNLDGSPDVTWTLSWLAVAVVSGLAFNRLDKGNTKSIQP